MGRLTCGLTFAGGELLFLLLLAATAYALGRRLCRRLPILGAAEPIAVSTTLGLVALAHLAFLLALAGRLSRGPLLLVFAAIHLACFGVWRELAADLRRRHLLGGLIGLVAGIPLFLLALYPPTAFDATLYHLPFARAFAASGRLPFLPDLRFPVFPQLDETLFAIGLLFAGDVAAHLVQLLSTLLTAALLVAWGRRAFSSRAGWLAAAAFLGNPIAIHLGTSAYVEAGLTLFGTASLYCAWRWSEDEGERPWLVLAAVFAACAADVKYLGLFFVAAIGVWILCRRAGGERRLRDLLLFSAIALLVLAPWYGRIVYYTGNPVFPFMERVFGRSSWAPSIARLPAPPGATRPDRAVTVLGAAGRAFGAIGSLAALPWDVTFERGAVGRQPPFSPLYLAALPLLAAAAFRDRRVRRLLLLAAAYALLFPALPRDSRYLMPALPILSLALGGAVEWLAGALARARRSPSARGPALAIAVSLGVVFLLPGWLYAFYRIGRQGSLPVTAAEREVYLARQLPVYPAVAFLNGEGRRTGSSYTVYALFAENLCYFADGRFLGEWVGPARFATVLPAAGDPASLARRLRELGADRLLIATDQAAFHLPSTPAWRRRFRPLHADAHAEVYEILP